MSQDRDDYMRRQEADHDLLRMRDPKAPYGRNRHGSPNRPNEHVQITISGDPVMAERWAEHIRSNAPILNALPIPCIKVMP